MITPPLLHKGDKVEIVATARKVTLSDITEGVEILQSWGLKVVFAENLFEEDNQFAGTDEMRAADLQNAINDRDIKAIFCARGGYGTVRIIDRVDFSGLLDNPKWIIGFSDVTVIHNKMNNLGIESIHAPMMVTIADATPESKNALRKILFGIDYETDEQQGKCETISYTTEVETCKIANRKGTATGEVVGGNLSILYSQIGSNSDIQTNDKILFIEDLDEYLYHIDRMMMSLKRSGKLEHLKGLIVGAFSDMHDNTIPFGKTAEEIIMEAVKDYDYPVCFNMPFGHISNNMPITLGRKVTLDVGDKEVNLKFEDKGAETDKKTQLKQFSVSVLWFTIFFVIALLLGFLARHFINN